MPSEDRARRVDFRCWVKIPVRWGDMDAIGHVNNAAYFTYCESARLEYLNRIWLERRFWEATEGPALAHAALNFRRSVRHPAMIEVGVRVPEVRNRSFRMDYGIFLDATDTLVADGTSVIVWADYRAERASEVPAQVRDMLLLARRSIARIRWTRQQLNFSLMSQLLPWVDNPQLSKPIGSLLVLAKAVIAGSGS